MRPNVAVPSWVVLSAFAAMGQGAPASLEFEVASVRRTVGRTAMKPGLAAAIIGFKGGPGTNSPGRITYSGVSLKMLLSRAYVVSPYQISGPGWLDTEAYDIVANVPPGTDNERLSVMLQNLLTARFRIELHRETKDFPVYRLTVAKNGPRLKPAVGKPATSPDEGEKDALKARISAELAGRQSSGDFKSRSINMTGVTVARFAAMLSALYDRPVKDMTGLDGTYDFSLAWAADDMGSRGDRSFGKDARDLPPAAPLFTAIQEQLGLKLEPGKGPVELLVIDRVEKAPTGN